MWALVPWPGIEPGPSALGVQSLSHWATRELHLIAFLIVRISDRHINRKKNKTKEKLYQPSQAMAVSQVWVTVQQKREHLHPQLSPGQTGQRCDQFPSSSPRGPQVIPNEVLYLQIPAWTKPGTPYTGSWPCWLNQFIHFYLKERKKTKKKATF